MAIQGVNNSVLYTGNTNTVNKTKQTATAIEPVKASVNNTNMENATTRIGNGSELMVKDAVNEANSKLKISNRRCQFTYEKDINRVSVKLIDEDTGEVIREIPSEETLEMIRRLKEMTGLLVDEQR